jgi:hypothetical protein
MVTLKHCAKVAGLNVDELILGVEPTARHRALLQSYQPNLHRDRVAVRRMIASDLLDCLEIGAQRRAADLLVVLRLFLSERGDISRRRSDRRESPCACPGPCAPALRALCRLGASAQRHPAQCQPAIYP